MLFLSCILVSQLLTGQRLILFDKDQKVQNLILQADSAYFKGNYTTSIQYYRELVEIKNDESEFLFNCSLGFVANNQIDSAFRVLFAIVDSNYKNSDAIEYTEEFEKLHKYREWNTLISKINTRFHSYCQTKGIKNEEVAKKIKLLLYKDQKYQTIKNLKSRYANAYPHYNLKALDSLTKTAYRGNVTYLKQLFHQNGYLWKSDIGEDAVHTLWLIVQHADFDTTFQKEYLAHLKTAVDQQQANAQEYAYLLDRVRKNTGQNQVYGTQMQYITSKDPITGNLTVETRLWPVEDEAHLDQRRKEVGLMPIKEYMQMMKLYNNH